MCCVSRTNVLDDDLSDDSPKTTDPEKSRTRVFEMRTPTARPTTRSTTRSTTPT
jgi:hypothetical protein